MTQAISNYPMVYHGSLIFNIFLPLSVGTGESYPLISICQDLPLPSQNLTIVIIINITIVINIIIVITITTIHVISVSTLCGLLVRKLNLTSPAPATLHTANVQNTFYLNISLLNILKRASREPACGPTVCR